MKTTPSRRPSCSRNCAKIGDQGERRRLRRRLLLAELPPEVLRRHGEDRSLVRDRHGVRTRTWRSISGRSSLLPATLKLGLAGRRESKPRRVERSAGGDRLRIRPGLLLLAPDRRRVGRRQDAGVRRRRERIGRAILSNPRGRRLMTGRIAHTTPVSATIPTPKRPAGALPQSPRWRPREYVVGVRALRRAGGVSP